MSPKEVAGFLEQLFKNKFAEAERMLQQLEEKYPEEKRYIHALKGIYHSYSGEDHDSLIYMLYLNEEIRKRRREIIGHLEKLSKLLGKEDRYFTAWRDVIQLSDKLPKPAKASPTSEG
ncbi:MAG: hypothetical protein QXU87_00915 [Candidatus Caldarchaeum sp.]